MDENEIKNNNSEESLKTIHTYTSDMADAVRMNEASVIKIALAEKDKRDREEVYKKAEGTGVSKFLLALGGIILLAGAGVGVYFVIDKNKKDNAPQEVTETSIDTIISYDSQAFVDLSNATNATDIVASIKKDVEKKEKAGSIKSLFLTRATDGKSSVLKIGDLLSLIKSTAPSSLVRTLSGEYMLGVYESPSTPSLFLVLKIKDFNQAYASTLTWEKTLLNDMFILFNVDVSGNRSSLFEKEWKDIILNNKDARILYDEQGNDILYYIFVDKSTIIITDSQDAIKEVSARILTKATKPL